MPTAPLDAAQAFLQAIKGPACLLVAVSGGSDSTGLLLALHESLQVSDRHDITLHAVTIDHALRSGSADEARAVTALCDALSIPHSIRRWDAEKPGSGLSAAARAARYALIGALAGEIGADAIILGHTLGDQQETIAMRASRSARDDNLGRAGMADAVLYQSRHWFLRPFLNVTRTDIRRYLNEKQQSWIDDPSNDDAKYERVRMRQHLGNDVATVEALSSREDISSRAADWIGRHASAFSSCVVRLDASGLGDEPSVTRYALSALAAVVGGRAFAMPAQTMDRVMAFVAAGKPGRMTGGRAVFDLRSDALYLYRERRNIEPAIVPAGGYAVWDGRFEIINRLHHAVSIRPGVESRDQTILPLMLPSGIVKRALSSFPCVEADAVRAAAFALPGIMARPILAPYDLFLPRFDLAIANRIADLFKRMSYPQPPV